MSRNSKTRRRAKRNARALTRKQDFADRYAPSAEEKDKPKPDFSKLDSGPDYKELSWKGR